VAVPSLSTIHSVFETPWLDFWVLNIVTPHMTPRDRRIALRWLTIVVIAVARTLFPNEAGFVAIFFFFFFLKSNARYSSHNV
jgi:hypothetical protein